MSLNHAEANYPMSAMSTMSAIGAMSTMSAMGAMSAMSAMVPSEHAYYCLWSGSIWYSACLYRLNAPSARGHCCVPVAPSHTLMLNGASDSPPLPRAVYIGIDP